MAGHTNTSLETIMHHDNRDFSQWSVVWSTSQIPNMDNAAGGGRHRIASRRKLRFGSLALGTLLAMHCRVAASAVTGGIFVFMMFLVLAVASLANPMRHFEVYLGQWSISGPGRAFHIIPMLDGIGIAICINALVRAVFCCSMAAISAVYVAHAVSDARLPFTYCRDFDFKRYEPTMKDCDDGLLLKSSIRNKRDIYADDTYYEPFKSEITDTLQPDDDIHPEVWRNISRRNDIIVPLSKPRQISVCEETYSGNFPLVYSTPAYNFFYVEVVQLRKDYNFGQFNLSLVIFNVIIWIILWGLMISEKIQHGKLIWNNMHTWIVIIPWIWTIFLSVAAITSLIAIDKSLKQVFRVGDKEFLAAISDAFEVGLYIHSVSVGTELVHGKGLNHYASGHIDTYLHGEMVWHSSLLLIMSTLHLVGAGLCGLVDYTQPSACEKYNMIESTLWIMPMYSKCASLGNYSHTLTTIIFGGLTFSYMTVAFVLLKTALHTIFEYRVKLVFVEQYVVGVLMLTCMGLGLIFSTNGSIALLESVDSIMTGITIPYVCLLELTALLYVYRSGDFMSDMNLATEDNMCASRLGIQWQMIPFITLGTLVVKIIILVKAEMPSKYMYIAAAPLLGVVVAVPLRACVNAYFFLRTGQKLGA